MATRAEHRRATLRALSDATTEVFEAHGLDATIDEIAARAGVSRRTVHRWVDGRDELVFIHPRLWLEYFDEAIAECHDAPLRDRLLHGSRRVSEIVDADPEPVARAMQVALAHPVLMKGYGAISQQWIDRMATEVALDDPHDPFRARVLGAAIMGVIDAALTEWLVTSPQPKLIDLVERGLELLRPILADPGTGAG